MNADEQALPAEFEEQVRDALLHLFDPSHLQTHPLLALVGSTPAGTAVRSRLLRQALLDAIATLDPGPAVATTSRAWRAYRILELRYLEDRQVADTVELMALGKTQYHREHQRALRAVASVLWERSDAAARWRPLAASKRPREEANVVRREAERLVSRAGGGQIDAPAVVREVAQLLAPIGARRNVALHLDIQAESAPMWGDRVVLRHALLTILTHAIDLTERGTIEVSLRHTVGTVQVQLSGPALGPLDSAQLAMEEGRSLVAALKGQMTLRPPAGAAKRWTVDLQFPATAGRALLVVDNNPEFIRLVERYLSHANWDVLVAEGVRQALTIAEQRVPQAILLDIMLPDRDGWDLLQSLKEGDRTRDIPVVVCSVLKETDVALLLGAAACLQKPIDQQQLMAILDGYR